jgi:hypothetical protein
VQAARSGVIPAALLDRPEPDEIDQHYINLFSFLNKTKSNETPALADIILLADSVLEDRLEFISIMLAGFDALNEAQKEKAETEDELKKSG